MGTKTIIKILSEGNISGIKKLVLQSNNNHYELRKKLNDFGYYLSQEKIVCENKKYYPIMKFIKSVQKNNNFSLKFGISQNKDYFEYLILKKREILKKIPYYRIVKRLKLKIEIKQLNKALK